METKKNLKTCKNGHQFFKSSDCPTCPICEEERKPKDNFLSVLGAPARRALENNGISTLEQLSEYSEKEVLNFHGMGKSTIPILHKLLAEKKFSFKLQQAIIIDNKLNEIELYIEQFPDKVQEVLRNIRKLIKKNAPGAEELFAYGMPAYKTHKKPLVYFAAFKNHIGFYATPSGHNEFQTELSKYKQGKGSVQFPLDQPIPYKLIERIVKFRLIENNEKTKKLSKKTMN